MRFDAHLTLRATSDVEGSRTFQLFSATAEQLDSLHVTYPASRNLIALFVAMARAVGNHFGDDLEAAEMTSPNTLEIGFRPSGSRSMPEAV